jgi:hypothetical protein
MFSLRSILKLGIRVAAKTCIGQDRIRRLRRQLHGVCPSPERVLLLSVVIVANQRGLASDPQVVNTVNIGELGRDDRQNDVTA